MYFERYDYLGNSFEQTYRCYPASFIDKPQLEAGDKIIMPPSALDRLASLHIEYPMLFELCNTATDRISHCGVLEFIAEEGMVYMPYWMMQNLLLQEGDIVQIKNATLPKGTYVKLQPHTKDFLDISNPKAILETTLRNYSCLTAGDSIMVPYNNKKYYIDIVETKPKSAISIIETDCEVDFAPPLDFKEPERPSNLVTLIKHQVKSCAVRPFSFKEASTLRAHASLQLRHHPFVSNSQPIARRPLDSSNLCGSARRLDGKSSTQAPVAPSLVKSGQTAAANGSKSSAASTSQSSSSRQSSGKLIFGSNAGPAPKDATQRAPKEESPEKEEAKFEAFTGKKYSLKG
ncbi:hypothetical protein KSP40_PGU012304 [Platanthera guangdongensis]|uniref:Ubiquitin fusion degradaton protein n=1 Tax=Platanthera guangdongensis TaxID=2320717 RepID=A0ABR2LSH4_9ASPA